MNKINDYKLIICIVNRGFSDSVMSAAREMGARGGTVMHGRGTSNFSHMLFGMPIEPEKEVVLIASQKDSTRVIMERIFERAGLATPGSGICLALPIEDIIGIKLPDIGKFDDDVFEPDEEQKAEK